MQHKSYSLWIGLSVALWSYAGIALGADKHRLTLDLEYANVGGHVQVRESSLAGTRLALHDLGIDHALIGSLGYEHHSSDVSSWQLRARWFDESGTTRFPQQIDFNGGQYQAGATLDARPRLIDVMWRWQRQLWKFGDGGRVQGLLGLNLSLLDFKIHGTRNGGDPTERFSKQATPLPLLGLRIDYPLSADSTLYAEAYGFHVNHLNSLRNEGGTIYLTQTNATAEAGYRRSLARNWQIRAGARYDYLAIHEHSNEDGNHFLQHATGVFVSLGKDF